MRNKLCKKIFMVIFCLCYGACWLDGNVSCDNPFKPAEPLTEEERQAQEESERQERKAREERERQEREAERERLEMLSNLAPCVDGTVKIGTQVWQKCNLNVKPSTGESSCYNNDPANCKKFGRLYDWATAMVLPDSCNSTYCASQISAKHRGLCPNGWHIPSGAEWRTLIDYIESDKGCTSCAGKYLKVKGWRNGSSDALDSYGFAALPGGYYSSWDGFNNVGIYGYWWSSGDYSPSNADGIDMGYNYEGASYKLNVKSVLQSVRCLQD